MHVEDADVEAFALAPDRFSWRTKKEIPDLKKCAKALRDAEAREPTLLAKTKDRYKRQLTVDGQKWIRRNAQRLTAALEVPADIPPPASRPKDDNDTRRERELGRLLSTSAYKKVSSGAANEVSTREAEEFFRLNDYITGSARAAKIARVANMFDDQPEIRRAIEQISGRALGES